MDRAPRILGAAADGGEDPAVRDAAFTAAGLARPVPPVSPETPCAAVFQRFVERPDLSTVAVVEDGGRVVGLVDRAGITTTFARPLLSDLYARRPIQLLMERDPLVVEASLTLAEVGQRISRDKPAALTSGFAVVEGGLYRGIGCALDLMALSAEQAEIRSRQLEKARRAAEEANRAKTAFLANMSHEIRTPLNAIMGFAEILEQEMLGPLGNPMYKEYSADIVQSGGHLMELINDLLDLSKAEADRLDLIEGVVDVPRVVAGCVRLVQERAAKARVHVSATMPPHLPPLSADERKLRQMLLNLLSNAVKFTESGGSVTVAASLCDGGLALAVADNGIGMTPEEMRKALEPWGQIDSALGRRYAGSGLGLPLTKRLVELHDGALDLESAPGIGTTITLLFPPERVLGGTGHAAEPGLSRRA